MSKMRRVTEFALGGLAILIAFSIAGYILGFGLGELAGKQQANTNSYARHAQDEIERTCAGLSGIAQTECIVRVIEATNEHQRSEQDLNAQRDMARWALLMLFATVVMAFITALGVYYVWRTLVATQRMAGDQKHIGAAQTRAYLSLSDASFWVDASGRPTFKLVVRNTGNTPSFSGTENIAFVPSSAEIDHSGSLKSWFVRQNRFLIDLGASEETTFITGMSTPVAGDPDWMMSAIVKITYKTVLDAMPREAIFTLVFNPQFDWPKEANPIKCTISTLQRSDVEESGGAREDD